jgi:hypothetical protein
MDSPQKPLPATLFHAERNQRGGRFDTTPAMFGNMPYFRRKCQHERRVFVRKFNSDFRTSGNICRQVSRVRTDDAGEGTEAARLPGSGESMGSGSGGKGKFEQPQIPGKKARTLAPVWNSLRIGPGLFHFNRNPCRLHLSGPDINEIGLAGLSIINGGLGE